MKQQTTNFMFVQDGKWFSKGDKLIEDKENCVWICKNEKGVAVITDPIDYVNKQIVIKIENDI